MDTLERIILPRLIALHGHQTNEEWCECYVHTGVIFIRDVVKDEKEAEILIDLFTHRIRNNK